MRSINTNYCFRVYFGREEECRNHFRKIRESRGIVCKKCGSTKHYWQESCLSYECKKCKHRTSLRNGTVMENSNLPFRTWYKAIFLLCLTKDKIPAQRIQKLVGCKRYEPIFQVRRKLDGFVSQLKDTQTLEGIIKNSKFHFKVKAYTIETRAGDIFDEKQKRHQVSLLDSISKVLGTTKYPFYFKADIVNGKTLFDDDRYLDVTDYVKFRTIGNKGVVALERYGRTYFYVELIVNNKRMPPCEKILEKYLPIYFDEFTGKLNRLFFEEETFTKLLYQATIHMNNCGYKMS